MPRLRLLTLFLVFSLGAATGAAAQKSLLNVSYDPTREFYAEANQAFSERWRRAARRLGRALSRAALRRAAPARGVGARTRGRGAGAAARRALRRARRQGARRAQALAARPA